MGCDNPTDPTAFAVNSGNNSLRFAIFADTPYNEEQVDSLPRYIEQLNLLNKSFVIHLGDIKGGTSPCVETYYVKIANFFHESSSPVFFIPGDNEWNDCDDPNLAWDFWWSHLHNFEDYWPDTFDVERQTVREENFAWVSKKVLLIGINLVGGKIINQEEWDLRLAQDAEWVTTQFESNKNSVGAAVVFAHASPQNDNLDIFFDTFVLSAQSFEKPILYINGNNHIWLVDTPFPKEAPNVTQVQLKGGNRYNSPPILITVNLTALNVFDINHQFSFSYF